MSIDWNHLRKSYPIIKEQTYLASAGISGVHEDVLQKSKEWFDLMANKGSGLNEEYDRERVETKNALASILKTTPDRVALTSSSSLNMNIFALMLKGKKEVIIPEDEYPASILPWYHHGFNVIKIPSRSNRIFQEDILSQINSQTAAVVLSYVQFQTGFKSELKPLSEELKSRSIPLIINASQAIGAFDLDVENLSLSALTCSCHKWLGAGVGQSIVYLSKDFTQKYSYPIIGWGSVEKPSLLLNNIPKIREDVGVLEVGSLPFSLMSAVRKSIEINQSIGIQNIEKRILSLSDYLEKRLLSLPLKISTPRKYQNEKSGILSFQMNNTSSKNAVENLKEKNIITHLRRDHIRVSLHFYNNEEDIDRLIDALKT